MYTVYTQEVSGLYYIHIIYNFYKPRTFNIYRAYRSTYIAINFRLSKNKNTRKSVTKLHNLLNNVVEKYLLLVLLQLEQYFNEKVK